MDSSILLLVVTVGLLVMLTMSRRRQQRDQQTVQSQLAPGTEVMTSSGLFATVVSVEGDVVVLRTGPGQESRWDRRAVVRVVTAAGSQSDTAGEPSGDGDLAHEGPAGGDRPEPGGSTPPAGDPPPDRG